MGVHRYSLLAGLVLTFVALVAFLAPTDPDVWWHLRNGQLVLSSGVPHADVYSFTASGREWLVQEWLTEVVMYSLKSAFGYGALSLLFGLLQAAGGFVVYTLARRAGAGRIVALLALMLFCVFAAPTWGVRPQVLTPIFLGIFYLLLLGYRDNPAKRKLLWALPLLMALWTNLHASYFMGIALVGAFVVGQFLNNWLYRPEQPPPLKPLVAVLGGCLAATLLNPYFVELWTYPLTYVLNGTSNPLLKYTQEWQSPNFHEPGNLLFGVSIVLLALVGLSIPAREEKRLRWRLAITEYVDATGAIVFGAFTLLALQAVRLVPIYGVIALPMLAGGLARVWPVLGREKEDVPGAIEGRVNLGVGVVAIIVGLVMIPALPQAQSGKEPRSDTLYSVPVQGADYIASLPPSTRLYNDFIWGGFLIYRLYPEHKVFIDGRADMYRVGIFEDSVVIQNAGSGWREALDKYGVNTAITLAGGPLDYALAHDKGWVAGYHDRLATVYRKAP